MDLGKLLNPVNEHNMYDEGTEEDICRVVLERCESEQDREKNASDGIDDDPDESSEIKPSHWKALAAISTLSKYIADLDEPFACKLEVVLTSFSRQTRLDASNSLRSTTLTDLFAFQAS